MIARTSLCKFESSPTPRHTVGMQCMLVEWMLTAQMNASYIHTQYNHSLNLEPCISFLFSPYLLPILLAVYLFPAFVNISLLLLLLYLWFFLHPLHFVSPLLYQLPFLVLPSHLLAFPLSIGIIWNSKKIFFLNFKSGQNVFYRCKKHQAAVTYV